MTTTSITSLKELLSTPKKIVIVPHRNPDGDAMGSTLALALYLNAKGHKAQVIAPNSYPDFLQWLPHQDHVLFYDAQNKQSKKALDEAQVLFTLDFNHLSRVGYDMQQGLEAFKGDIVMIDHHQQPDNYANITFSDTSYCSTCQLVYWVIEQLGDVNYIDQAIATNLYTGIMTDTGSFRFRSTTAETHRVVANLIEAGAQNQSIHENVYDTFTSNRLKLLGVALKNMTVLEEFNAAYITLSQEEMDEYNYQKGDTEGFVNYCLTLKGIRLAAIFKENTTERLIKISLRSKGDFSVNEMARAHFQGGGHTNAAGGKSDASLKETVAKFISILPTYKSELTS